MDAASLIVIMFAVAFNGNHLISYQTSFVSTLGACMEINQAFLKPDQVKAVKGIDFDIEVECRSVSPKSPPPLGAPKLFPDPPADPDANSETGT